MILMTNWALDVFHNLKSALHPNGFRGSGGRRANTLCLKALPSAARSRFRRMSENEFVGILF